MQFGPRSKPCKRQTAPAAGGTATPRRNEPCISRLEPVTFFRVSKLTHCRPKEAVQSGPRLKPCKRQTASAATGYTGELLLETICVSPVVFLVFAAWETPGSGAQRRRTGEGLPCCKGLKKTRGGSMLKEGAPLCDRLRFMIWYFFQSINPVLSGIICFTGYFI